MNSTNILEVIDLKKSYGPIKAVDNISFVVRENSLFAFLGQNGAGKSTTIKMIATLLTKDDGVVKLNGNNDLDYIRNNIGIVFQDNVLDNLLTVKENLLLRGSLYIKNKDDLNNRYHEVITKLKLEEIENQRFKTLSGGQKRRVEIARALFANPKLLILDEPTTGLDPETRLVVWKLIDTLRKEDGITVFLTTHYMEEAANADYVIIIDKGKIIATGSPSELKNTYSKDYFKLVPKDKAQLVSYLEANNRGFRKVANQYFIEISSSDDAVALIVALKDNIKSFEVVNGTLDDVFVNVVGGNNE